MIKCVVCKKHINNPKHKATNYQGGEYLCDYCAGETVSEGKQ